METQARGTVRIFMAPKYDENNKEWSFKQQRRLMIEMDRFTVNCNLIAYETPLIPYDNTQFWIAVNLGENLIRRKSIESTVTIPYDQTFRNLDKNRPNFGTPEEYKFNFCGCGWPHHMLIPRGRLASDGGMECQLFVMVSKYDDDHVEQDIDGTCSDASAYCGIRNRLYPDKRNMGFPFDRPSTKDDDLLKEFLLPNMCVADCKIIFTDESVERGADLSNANST